MDAQSPIVIIGSGLAGYTLARELRKRDKAVPITLITADHGGFYSKPMLSNGYASGRAPESLVTSTAESMASQLGITVLPNTIVTAIDRGSRTLTTSSSMLTFGRLVLALGADPIRLPIDGDGAAAVMSVNDWSDYLAFRARADAANRVLVIGAGLIGCEFANDLCLGGKSVTVVDIAEQPLGRLLPPKSADVLRSGLAAAGVIWHLGKTVARIDRTDDAFVVTLSDGAVLTVDVVLSAIGLRPRVALATEAGLLVNRGIVVDRRLCTNDPAIFALGDCAEVDGLVLPYVMPIMQAARALAPILCGEDTPVVYPAMPVVVKTPNMPAVVAPPIGTDGGAWVEETDATGARARFLDASGRMTGFTLLGAATADKAAWTKELPAWLPNPA